jgi:hypothetical protein
METDRAKEQARIQLVGCVRHACMLVQGAWVCGRLVHLRVMCANACGGVLQTVWKGLAFVLKSTGGIIGFLLHVDEATGAKALFFYKFSPKIALVPLTLFLIENKTGKACNFARFSIHQKDIL